MTEPKKPQRPVWPLPPTPSKPVDQKKSGGEAVGRVVHDSRGNAVWDWTSKTDSDSTTHMLRQLDSPELSLADDAGVKRKDDARADPGINPYNQRNDQRAGKTDKPGNADKKSKDKAPKDSVLRQLTGKR